MIIKLGIKDGFDYIQTVGDVSIRTYDIIKLLEQCIDSIDSKENFTWDKASELINMLAERNLEKIEANEAFDKILSIATSISERISKDDVSFWKLEFLKELIEDIDKDKSFNRHIHVFDYIESNEINSNARIELIANSKFKTYLLNDEGKTIDIIY